jgi:hypothetical protein
MQSTTENFLYFMVWCFVWIGFITFPPGSREIWTAYRLNFFHGVISTVMAALCLCGWFSDNFTSMVTISYFVVDFINNLLNDFYFKVKSYQPPSARKMEYCHHILCCGVGIACELFYKQVCTFDRNPFIQLMFAEVSTPFLMTWRVYPDNKFLGWLFAIVFICNRIVYHAIIFIPECIRSCNKPISYSFAIMYNAMNFFFLYKIVDKLLRKDKRTDAKSNN